MPAGCCSAGSVPELESTSPTGLINVRTTLSELFDAWIAAKVTEDGLKEQSEGQYRGAWRLYGTEQLGELRIGELSTSRADAHLKSLPTGQAHTLRVVLSSMYGMTTRFDVVRTNPIRETKTALVEKKPTRALTVMELD